MAYWYQNIENKSKTVLMSFGEEVSEFSTLFTSYTMNQQPRAEDNSKVESPIRNRSPSKASIQAESMNPSPEIYQPPAHSQPKPLQIRKPSNQVRVAQSQQQLKSHNFDHVSSTPVYPPRRSSIRRFHESDASSPTRAHFRQHTDAHSAYRSTISDDGDLIDTSVDASTPSMTTSQSTRSGGSSNHRHLPSASSSIIGNFIPVSTNKMDNQHSTHSGGRRRSIDEHARQRSPSRIPRPTNPYEFEPDTPYTRGERQTQFADFIEHHSNNPYNQYNSSPRGQRGHVKNARSEENGPYRSQDDEYLLPPKPNYATLQRSESSPSLVQARFEALSRLDPQGGNTPRGNATSPDIFDCHAEDNAYSSLPYRGRSPSPSRPNRKYEQVNNSPTYYQASQGYAGRSRSRSPVRREGREASESAQYSSVHGRHSGKTQTSILDDVAERDEHREYNSARQVPAESPVSFASSPKKRSRSPMKKMFGENGWLGRSPDEIQDVKLQVKKAAALQKDKPTMMGKFMNKLGEFAEKADISPGRVGRSANDKHPKISILSVSLGPPEQARLLMEVELMIVHTANTFLMNQFSQGRMAVDSIKKTVDHWKSRGRHVVIEFQYDQATQRDLVAANQHNFRFYGERAGNDVRINSMLYNWKQVASMMAIRTFCDADTVILKLLFDVEQILELLGGAEAIMLRLQQIRATSNEMMRLARQRKRAQSNPDEAAGGATPGRAATWLSHSSNATSSRNPSIDTDPYGGMKLVPDNYTEGGQFKSNAD